MMIKIYHNPRCSKSREGVKYLEEKGLDFQIIEYLKEDLSTTDLMEIIQKLGIQPIDLVRTKEAIWKENFKGKELTNDQIVEAMVLNPRLIERPIVIKNNKAVIARPLENIEEIL